MEEYISLGLNIALLVFVFFGVFWGFIRGLRKTASRGIFLIITTIVLLLVTPLITKALLGIKLNVHIELENSTLTGSNNLEEIITFFIKEYIGADFVADHPEFANFIISLPILLVNAILYVLLFWICKYLLYPLNYLLYKLAFAPRKKKESLGFSEFNNEEGETSPLNTEEQPNAENIQTEVITEQVENTPAEISPQPETHENSEGLFIVKDPHEEFNKHEKLTEELKELTIKADKKEKKRLKKEIKKEKKRIKKHRILGGLIGGLCGLVVMTNTFIPVYGLLDILDTANNLKIKNLTEEETSLSVMTDGLSDKIENGYNNSVFEKLTKYSGIKGIALASFDSLTSTKVNDNKITLRKDIESLTTAIQNTDDLIGKYKEYAKDGDLADLTKEELTILLSDTKTLLNNTKQVKLVDAISDYILPIACNYMLENEIEFSDNPAINRLIAEILVELLESSGIDLFAELNSLIDVAEYLNNQNLLTVILSQKIDDPIAVIKALDDNFASELTTKFYQLKLVDTVLPQLMNITFTALDSAIDFGYEENSATSEQLQTSLTNFLDKTIKFAKTLNSSSDIYLTTNSLIPLGEFLDSIKSSNLINTETYNNLISFAQSKISDIINEIIPEELQPSINGEVVGNLDKVSNWQDEMTIINQAITLLRHKSDGFIGKAVEDKDLREGLSIDLQISEAVLKNLGKALDVLDSSKLFGSANVRILNLDGTGNKEYTLSTMTYIMCDVLDYVQNEGLSDFEELNEFMLKVENNLLTSKHTYDNEIKFWENEFTCIAPLVIELNSTLNADEFEISTNLGRELDKAKKSVMLGNNACLTLMNNALDIVKDGIISEDFVYNDGSDITNPQTLDDKIYEIFDGISIQLSNTITKDNETNIANFWEYEIEKYNSLIDIADKASTISDISDATALGEDLDNAFASFTIPRLALSRTFAHAMKDVKYDNLEADDYINLQINATIDNVASKLESESFVNTIDEKNFWQIELSHISNIMDIDFNDNLVDNLVSIGKSLDEVTNGYTKVTVDDPQTSEDESNEEFIRGSKLITHEDLRLILASAVTECKDSLTDSFEGSTKNSVETALTSIQHNLADTTNIPLISFEFELGKLKTLSELDVNSDYFQKGETATEQQTNREGLENLGESLDVISYNIKSTTASSGGSTISVYIYNEELNSAIVTRPIINTLIADIIDNAKITKTALTTNEEAYNNIVESIKTEIMNKSTNNYVFSWLRELGFINKLIQLDFETTLEFSNIANNIGSVLDGISFNKYTVSSEINFFDVKYSSATVNGITSNIISYLPNATFYNPELHTTYGNSILITRESLLNAVNAMIDTLKEEDSDTTYNYNKEDLINELLDNTTDKIATTNTQLISGNYYQGITESFNDLTSIKDIIDGDLDIGSLKLEDIDANIIDQKLSSIQDKKISGNITTRKMAIYVLDCIYEQMKNETPNISGISYSFDDHPAGKYLQTLKTYYTSRENVDEIENYHVTGDTTGLNHPNPFVSLQDRILNPTNYTHEI